MVDVIKKYFDNRFQLIKLELINVLANVAARLINSFLILIIGLFILMMFSFSLAYWLATVFESDAIGFAIVGGIYILIFIIFFIFSKDAIDNKIKDQIVKAALKADEDLKDNDDDVDYVV